MRLVEPACTWLMHIAMVRGRTRSRETWRTYGEALYDWWQTLEANDWLWDDVSPLHVAAYRDRMLSGPSEHTKRPYARSTINGRVRTLAAFYAWCVESKRLQKSPFLSVEMRVYGPRRQRMLAHLDVSGGIRKLNELAVRHMPHLPRPLSVEEIRAVVSELGTRDRLIVEWALTAGLRRMEVAALSVQAVQRSSSSEPLCRIRLTTTKGDKPRFVYPSLPLVDRTRAYIREERAAYVRRAKRRNAKLDEPASVFLNSAAKPLTPRAVGAMFSEAAMSSGVAVTFHALRHTYATTMLSFLQRQAREGEPMNPLLTLQVLLGHSDISMTSIYLRVLAADLSVIERSVDDLYEALR
jgi:site-specific recombinase XerD